MRISVLLATVLLLCQCAKKNTEDLQGLADKSFDYLMELNYPEAEKLESGIYIEWLRDVAGPVAVDGNWLMLNYRGTNLEGQVFSTRYRDEAIHENTFTWRTRYTPHYLQLNPNAVLSPGEIEALHLMSEGDSMRLYIPTKLGYGFALITFQYGYEGWLNTSKNRNAVSTVSNVPVIVELSLRDIITDPAEYEHTAMLAKAVELGFDVSRDSPDKITDSLYFRYTEVLQTVDHVGEDSTFYISYTGRFLDDFVLKTNDPLVGVNELMDTRSAFMPISYRALSSSTALPEEAIRKAIRSGRVLYDSQFQIIFTSVWGFGAAGQAATATSPVVYPYTPLYFDIKVHPWGYDPNATESE